MIVATTNNGYTISQSVERLDNNGVTVYIPEVVGTFTHTQLTMRIASVDERIAAMQAEKESYQQILAAIEAAELPVLDTPEIPAS